MTGATYDAGALIAADRASRRMWLLHGRLLERGVQPNVPSVVLAQVWRGGRQARLARLLRGCKVTPLATEDACRTGVALGASGTGDVVDAAVVVGAGERGDAIVTSDPADLERVAAALGLTPALHVV